MLIEFHKMHGLGNDFVIIESKPNQVKLNQDLIKRLSNRKLGIGCDQLLLILINDQENDQIEMLVFNEDGSNAGFCGNGLRCVAGLYLGRKRPNLDHILIKSGNGVNQCFRGREKNEIVANIGKCVIKNPAVKVDYNGREFLCDYLDIGNYHLVVFLNDDLNEAEMEAFVRVVYSTLPGVDVNVSFARVGSTRNRIELRVWENACGLTLACGSGACATFYAAQSRDLVDPTGCDVCFSIGCLHIRLDDEENIFMSGPYEYVFSGVIDI